MFNKCQLFGKFTEFKIAFWSSNIHTHTQKNRTPTKRIKMTEPDYLIATKSIKAELTIKCNVLNH